jgi:hypothetical protein
VQRRVLSSDVFHRLSLSIGPSSGTGFGDRLLNEVKRVGIKEGKLKIYAPPERKVSQLPRFIGRGDVHIPRLIGFCRAYSTRRGSVVAS